MRDLLADWSTVVRTIARHVGSDELNVKGVRLCVLLLAAHDCACATPRASELGLPAHPLRFALLCELLTCSPIVINPLCQV